jgi:hypothetical protein
MGRDWVMHARDDSDFSSSDTPGSVIQGRAVLQRSEKSVFSSFGSVCSSRMLKK